MFIDRNKFAQVCYLSLELHLHSRVITVSGQTGADKSNKDWMKKMASSGTLADRAAALSTLIQEDVVHNISSLENMVNMVKKKDRRESMAAIG